MWLTSFPRYSWFIIWLAILWYKSSRIQIFKELGHKIERHKTNILNTIEQGLSNARVESINTKIKLSIRKAYGFRNYENMVDMIMLVCSKLSIPLPNRGVLGMKVM